MKDTIKIDTITYKWMRFIVSDQNSSFWNHFVPILKVRKQSYYDSFLLQDKKYNTSIIAAV